MEPALRKAAILDLIRVGKQHWSVAAQFLGARRTHDHLHRRRCGFAAGNWRPKVLPALQIIRYRWAATISVSRGYNGMTLCKQRALHGAM
jgi:hypothetical protein